MRFPLIQYLFRIIRLNTKKQITKTKMKIKMYLNNKVDKNKGKIAFIILCSGILAIASLYIGFLTPLEFGVRKALASEIENTTFEGANTPKIAEFEQICPSEDGIQKFVWCLLDKEGLTLEEKIKAVSIIECESKWNPSAFNSKTDDFGLWQISYQYQIKTEKTTIACAMDIECSTKFAISLYREWGNSFKAWTCN